MVENDEKKQAYAQNIGKNGQLHVRDHDYGRSSPLVRTDQDNLRSIKIYNWLDEGVEFDYMKFHRIQNLKNWFKSYTKWCIYYSIWR